MKGLLLFRDGDAADRRKGMRIFLDIADTPGTSTWITGWVEDFLSDMYSDNAYINMVDKLLGTARPMTDNSVLEVPQTYPGI